jgi:hypothetical protein
MTLRCQTSSNLRENRPPGDITTRCSWNFKVPFSRAAVEKEFMEHSTRDIEQR